MMRLLPKKFANYILVFCVSSVLTFALLQPLQALGMSQSGSSGVAVEVEELPFEIATIDSILLDVSFLTFGERLKINGKAAAGSTVKVFIQAVDGSYSLTKETVANSEGEWEIFITEKLPPGRYKVWVVCIDRYQREIISNETAFKIPDLTAQIEFVPITVRLPFSGLLLEFGQYPQYYLPLFFLTVVVLVAFLFFYRSTHYV